jgi:C-terminal processing protease CtpA/Prc
LNFQFFFIKKKGSLSSCNASLSSNQVSHTDTAEINLKSDESNNGTFGFTLQGAGVIMSSSHVNDSIIQSSSMPSYPVIGYVEPNSPAERCGLIQPGDRILFINNRSLEGLALEEARQFIRESGSNLKLDIEFDVADTIMLTSGTFQVKLLKKSLDLGISLACKIPYFKVYAK